MYILYIIKRARYLRPLISSKIYSIINDPREYIKVLIFNIAPMFLNSTYYISFHLSQCKY